LQFLKNQLSDCDFFRRKHVLYLFRKRKILSSIVTI